MLAADPDLARQVADTIVEYDWQGPEPQLREIGLGKSPRTEGVCNVTRGPGKRPRRGTCWDDAHEKIVDDTRNEETIIVVFSAQREADGVNVKLNPWDSAHVMKNGSTAHTLSRCEPQDRSLTKLTTVFTPSGTVIPSNSESWPTCAAALANPPSLGKERVIQVNRCLMDLSTRVDQMFTQDGNCLYSTCRLKDWSGLVPSMSTWSPRKAVAKL